MTPATPIGRAGGAAALGRQRGYRDAEDVLGNLTRRAWQSPLPGHGPVHYHRGGRGGLQARGRHPLQTRGMHWTVNGANAILALRCAILSNRFDDFWERRAGV